jgi:hypothetical protein
MGVDIYMRWEGFGKETKDNPNYKNQITGYQDNGKCGYLRIAYSYPNYQEAVKPFFWDWDKDFYFDDESIKKFIEIINSLDEDESFKKEMLDFAELGKKLNKEGKKPFVQISY